MRGSEVDGTPSADLPDRVLWQRSQAVEASEAEDERLLDLAGFADGRLDDDERERVAARLALDPDAAADIAAARALAEAGTLPEAPAAILNRAGALVGAEIIEFRPRHRTAAPWQGTARWASLAAAVVLAGWFGFALGSNTTNAALALFGGDDVSLDDLLDPGAAPLHVLPESTAS